MISLFAIAAHLEGIVASPPDAKLAPGTTGKSVGQSRLGTLHREAVASIGELESETQDGNSGSNQGTTARIVGRWSAAKLAGAATPTILERVSMADCAGGRRHRAENSTRNLVQAAFPL